MGLPNRDNLAGNPTTGQFKMAIGDLYDYVKGLHFWKPSTVVGTGDVIFRSDSNSSVYAKCTIGGTTGTTEPTWPTSGNTVTDGTATWTMQEIVNTPSFRNKIINGNFVINQRVVSSTVTLSAGAYGHDRWKAGVGGCTYTFATVENKTTITISAGSLVQVIEGINLQSGTHTLSWSGTAQGKIGTGSYSSTGVTGVVTGGTDTNIEFKTGTLSNVQLEQGNVATPFEQRPITVEEMLCYRYFETAVNGVAPFTDNINVINAGSFAMCTDGRASISFKMPKRTVPSLVIFAPLTTSCVGKVRRQSNGDINTIGAYVISLSAFNFAINSGVNTLYQLGFTADAEL